MQLFLLELKYSRVQLHNGVFLQHAEDGNAKTHPAKLTSELKDAEYDGRHEEGHANTEVPNDIVELGGRLVSHKVYNESSFLDSIEHVDVDVVLDDEFVGSLSARDLLCC